jgi:hypothetical protein
MRQPRRPVYRTATQSAHEVTLVGMGETDSHPPTRRRHTAVPPSIPPSPLPHIDANVLVVPLGSERPSWRQSPTDLTLERVRRGDTAAARRTPRTERPFWATAETVTPRGMLIAASTALDENQWVVVEIHPSGRPQSAPPLRIKALVVFAMDQIGFDVRFIAMTESTRAELERLTATAPVSAATAA